MTATASLLAAAMAIFVAPDPYGGGLRTAPDEIMKVRFHSDQHELQW